jgi:hypothetical protein
MAGYYGNDNMDERYLEKRKAIEHFFVPENKIIDSGNVIVSPSGNFELEIYRYSTGPKSWAYSRGKVKRLSDNKVIADVKRNYGSFWHTWVNHPNGCEYLLCGEDYQGYSIVNLSQETYDVFFPKNGYKGFGFCWTVVYPSPDGLVLAVDGCYWACPYEIVFYDFSNPKNLPLPEIDRCESVTDPVIGWIDNETFVFTVSYDARKSDGRKYTELSDEEQELLDEDPSQIDEVTEKFEWKRFEK